MTLPTITLEEVKSVYPGIPEGAEETVNAAILSTTALVQSSIVDSACGASYTEDQLKLIMMWLTAHIWQTANGVLSGISAGSTSESYQMSTDFFLKGTLHGQNAMLLDTNHCLAQLMADTDAALAGRQSYSPGIVSLHSNKQKTSCRC